jgi:5-(carboxyamino)imidazole ribonucleotide mutase
MATSLVGILMGSASDWDVMQQAAKRLTEFGVPWEARVISAHRSPGVADEYAGTAESPRAPMHHCRRGGAARLAGVLAAKTTLPILGVPMPSKHLQGMDSLPSTVQMPAGIPVATFAIGDVAAPERRPLRGRVDRGHRSGAQGPPGGVPGRPGSQD